MATYQPQSPFRRFLSGNRRSAITISVGIVVLIALLVISSSMSITIESGMRGVVFRKFAGGVDKVNLLGQGFHLVAPWNTVFPYDTRIQEQTDAMDVLASNGLDIHLDLSFRYKVIEDKVGYLHDELGPGYAEKVVIPEIRAATRKVIGKYLPEELYSSKREAIQIEIFNETEGRLKPKYVHIDAVLIRSVTLPEKIATAIQRKLEQEQQRDEYEFRIQKESKEAERKRIEAQGIKDFQDIVSMGLNENILRWKGIEATKDLAKSSNTKIVVVGSGKDGLPLILGN
jgi:regulator of protease activity HflC (stomatin/prohibitin superfamily)